MCGSSVMKPVLIAIGANDRPETMAPEGSFTWSPIWSAMPGAAFRLRTTWAGPTAPDPRPVDQLVSATGIVQLREVPAALGRVGSARRTLAVCTGAGRMPQVLAFIAPSPQRLGHDR